jgi:hypothetical protein
MEDCQIAVQRVLTRVADLAIDEENFLMDLRELVSATGGLSLFVPSISAYPVVIRD